MRISGYLKTKFPQPRRILFFFSEQVNATRVVAFTMRSYTYPIRKRVSVEIVPLYWYNLP